MRLPSLGAGVVSHTQSGEDAAQRGEGDREGRGEGEREGRERERGGRERGEGEREGRETERGDSGLISYTFTARTISSTLSFCPHLLPCELASLALCTISVYCDDFTNLG